MKKEHAIIAVVVTAICGALIWKSYTPYEPSSDSRSMQVVSSSIVAPVAQLNVASTQAATSNEPPISLPPETPPKEEEKKANEQEQDKTWYIVSPKLNQCVSLSESMPGLGLQSPDDVIRFAASSNTELIAKFNGPDIVTLRDPSGQTETLGLIRGKPLCTIALKTLVAAGSPRSRD